MEVILLERVAKLGQMGEVVRVRDGFARNFLLKRGKALRATADNRAKFDGMKADLEARNLQAKSEATKVAEKVDGRNVVILRQASETGQLFGSVSVRDIIASFQNEGVAISRSQVMLDAPIKSIGKPQIAIAVHPEVEVGVTVTVARSAKQVLRLSAQLIQVDPDRKSGHDVSFTRPRSALRAKGDTPRNDQSSRERWTQSYPRTQRRPHAPTVSLAQPWSSPSDGDDHFCGTGPHSASNPSDHPPQLGKRDGPGPRALASATSTGKNSAQPT